MTTSHLFLFGWHLENASCDSNKQQLVTAAVMAGDGSCKGRQRQAEAATAMATVTAGGSNCGGG